jgi:hypothetical protein
VSFSPGFWMDETSGVLRPAVEAYLNHDAMTPAQIAAMRAYLRQWMQGDWMGDGIDDLRNGVNDITNQTALRRWLQSAYDLSIDPL